MCRTVCVRGPIHAVIARTYEYPVNSRIWKKSMQVVHTAGVPPSRGKSSLAIMSCTQNSKSALRNVVTLNNKTIGREANDTFG